MKHPETDWTRVVPQLIILSMILLLPQLVHAHHFHIGDISSLDLFLDNGVERYDPIGDPAYYYNLTHYTYVLYYGQFDHVVVSSILAAKPTMLVTNYYAMDHQTRELFAENNVTLIAYLPIMWTQRDIESTLGEVRQLLEDGADGIFVDEAVTMANDWELWYHGQIYKTVKEHDNDGIVIINPGTASIDEKSMLVADIICFEHEWRNLKNVEWATDYPGWRFMGISSNEFYKVMGYNVDIDSAFQDLEESRHMNIAYHYSADHYIWLPPWLDVYGGVAGSPHPVGDYSDLDSINSVRPEQYYPVIVTETAPVGNEYNSSVIEGPLEADNGNQSQADSSNGTDVNTDAPPGSSNENVDGENEEQVDPVPADNSMTDIEGEQVDQAIINSTNHKTFANITEIADSTDQGTPVDMGSNVTSGNSTDT